MKFISRPAACGLAFQFFRLVYAVLTLGWLGYRLLAIQSAVIRKFVLAEIVPSVVCIVLVAIASVITSILLVTMSNQLQSQRNRMLGSTRIKPIMILTILAELLAVAAGCLLFADLIDTSGNLQQAMRLEVEELNNYGLLKHGYDVFNCCGVDFEMDCSRSYPPFIRNGITFCHTGSPSCQNNCLSAVMKFYIEPLRFERSILFNSAMLLVVINVAIISWTCCQWFRKRNSASTDVETQRTSIHWMRLPETAGQHAFFTFQPKSAAQLSLLSTKPTKPTKPTSCKPQDKIQAFYEKLRLPLCRHAAIQILSKREAVKDSVKLLMCLSDEDWRQRRFQINFEGEDLGSDNERALRKWYLLLFRHLFSGRLRLFSKPKLSNECFYHAINHGNIPNSEAIQYYNLTGRLLARAIIDRVPIGRQLAPSILKHLLGNEITTQDLKLDDESFYHKLMSLKNLSAGDLRQLDLYFVYEPHPTVLIDLLPFNRSIQVDEGNLELYIDLMAKAIMRVSVETQLQALTDGFRSVVSLQVLRDFSISEQELAALISGHCRISIRALAAKAEYLNCDAQTVQINWFWRALHKLSSKDRRKFLRFATGYNAIPIEGSPCLTIMLDLSADVSSNLSTATECVNRILLPIYQSYEILEQKLILAIREGS